MATSFDMAQCDWDKPDCWDALSVDGHDDYQPDGGPIGTSASTSSAISSESGCYDTLELLQFRPLEPSFNFNNVAYLPVECYQPAISAADWLGRDLNCCPELYDPWIFNLINTQLPPPSTPSLSPVAPFPSSGQEVAPSSLSQFSPTSPFDCKWKDCCSSDLCFTIEKHRAHLKSHAETAREHWKYQHKAKRADGGIQCSWNGCTSKAKYSSEKLFEKHLVNIHINPLVCTVKGCRHTKPFRANHDLRRHIDTAHSETSKYRCPFSHCLKKGKGFPRKDKWTKHLFDHHDTEPCPYAHCLDGPIVPCVEKGTTEHIAKKHGIFECGLKGCDDGKVYGFSDTALSEHLQVVHNFDWEAVLKARGCAKAKGDNTLRNEHLA